MGRSMIYIAIFILCIFFHQINGQQNTLIAGHVLFRHGDRTPITTFPTDPQKESDWPNGFGQLTSAGIEQHHRLGAFLRTRYGTLLGSAYHPSEIFVRSTDIDRTLMSAQANLAGLYPALNTTNNSVPVHPIPIHTVPIEEDFLLGQNICPRYDQIEEEVDHSPEVVQMNAFYQPFFNQLQAWTGLHNITVYNAWDVADTIFVENIYHKNPDWANAAVQQNLSAVNDLAFHYLFSNNDSNRIRGGPAIKDIWLNMNDSTHGRSFHKVKMYSAHDTTVSAVLAFLGTNYPHQPQYASALFVDLFQMNTNYFVRVEYLNVTDSNKAYPYILDGCPAVDCPLETFTNIYQGRFPSNAAAECVKDFPPTPPTPGANKHLVTVLIILIVCLAATIFVMFLCIHVRRTERDPPLLGLDRSLQSV